MTSTDKNHAIYLDHIFVLTEPGAEVADQLVQMGLVEGTRNNHPGQGTSNRRFFLNNFTIELLYISDATEAKNGAGKNLNLYSRSDDPNLSPFGIISRVTNPGSVPEFRSWEYYPDFFNGSMCFYIGENSHNKTEPLCICMPPELPLKEIPEEYANHAWGLTSIQLEVPVGAPTDELEYFSQMGNVEIVYGKPHKLMINLNDGVLEKELDLNPKLPMVLKW